MTFLYFSMIKQHMDPFTLSILYLKEWVIGLDVLLFTEFINIVFILYYTFVEFIMLLYTFLVISFARYKEYITCQISFSKFSDVSLAFAYARAIANLWCICLAVNCLTPLPCCILWNWNIFSTILIILFGL